MSLTFNAKKRRRDSRTNYRSGTSHECVTLSVLRYVVGYRSNDCEAAQTIGVGLSVLKEVFYFRRRGLHGGRIHASVICLFSGRGSSILGGS